MTVFLCNFGFDSVYLVEKISFVEFQYWFLNSFKFFARMRQYQAITLLGSVGSIFEKNPKKGIFELINKEMTEIDAILGDVYSVQRDVNKIFDELRTNIFLATRKK